ncbi:hypothetical protein SRABI76_02158 [Microbacterium oxydans]|uniref:FUSC family protein n=1 Tax=Microbacterium oxydans TaxID=82380 RepID=UPI001E04AF01|nr:aromatic acid exporter family protein [Microbacterium oxydans]CAH0206804.1 hypothetical protein SRABI76_02158 [Microbacterium oxydans]
MLDARKEPAIITDLRARSRAAALTARSAVHPARLLLVAKTMLAVGLAWWIAPHMPGVTDEYPYYAPLGALLSMYPTLMGSARSSLQTLLGLATGIGLAALVVITIGPTWWTIPLIVGVGVLVSGTGWFGAGRDYVPIAALFVLIIGGQNADDYSLGYLTQTAVGVVVGLIVNFVVAPAPLTASAQLRVREFRAQLAAHLDDIAVAVSESWPPEREQWALDAGSLADTARSVRATLDEADESRRWNLRARGSRAHTADVHAQLAALDRIADRIRDVSETIADTIWDRPGALDLDPTVVAPLTDACHAVAAVIALDDLDSAEAHRVRGEAARAVRLLLETVDDRTVEARRSMGPGVLCAMHLRRILILAGQQLPD